MNDLSSDERKSLNIDPSEVGYYLPGTNVVFVDMRITDRAATAVHEVNHYVNSEREQTELVQAGKMWGHVRILEHELRARQAEYLFRGKVEYINNPVKINEV